MLNKCIFYIHNLEGFKIDKGDNYVSFFLPRFHMYIYVIIEIMLDHLYSAELHEIDIFMNSMVIDYLENYD